MTSCKIACYRFAAADTDVPHVVDMWIHSLRRVTNHLVLLWTCFVLSASSSSSGLADRPAYADGPPEAEISAPLQGLSPPDSGSQQAIERAAPDKAYALLEALKRRNGEPLPGYAGGRTFHNRERRLPGGAIKSTTSTEDCPAARVMPSGSLSNKGPARPTTPTITTVRSFH